MSENESNETQNPNMLSEESPRRLNFAASSGSFSDVTKALNEIEQEEQEATEDLVEEPVDEPSEEVVMEDAEELPEPDLHADIEQEVTNGQSSSGCGQGGLDDMSVDELTTLEQEAARKRLEKQQAQKQAVIEQIVQVVSTYGVTTEELVEALGGLKIKRKGVKAVIKFHDPETGKTWTGRGKTPNWLKDKDMEQFRVTPVSTEA